MNFNEVHGAIELWSSASCRFPAIEFLERLMTSEQREPRSFELLQATGELLANTLRSDSVEITFKTEVQSLVFSGYTGDHAVTTHTKPLTQQTRSGLATYGPVSSGRFSQRIFSPWYAASAKVLPLAHTLQIVKLCNLNKALFRSCTDLSDSCDAYKVHTLSDSTRARLIAAVLAIQCHCQLTSFQIRHATAFHLKILGSR